MYPEKQWKTAEDGPPIWALPPMCETRKLVRKFWNDLCMSFDGFISRTTNKEPILQTEELTQQEAMQKAEEIHQFREHRSRMLSIRDISQEERFKLKDELLDMYGDMRVSLEVQRQVRVDKMCCSIKTKSYSCERIREWGHPPPLLALIH